MSICDNIQRLGLFSLDHAPANLYVGSTKIAGWHELSYSGQSPLSVDCDYNVPPDALVVDGKCVQTGTPSPSSPAPISTITGNMTITGADGASSNTATVALGNNVCASLPDGTHDSYDAVTGILTKRVGKLSLTGTEVWSDQFHTGQSWSTPRLDVPSNQTHTALWSTFWPNVETGNAYINAYYTGMTLAQWQAAMAGKAQTIYYKLTTPTTVQLTPHLPVVRTGIKTLSIGADVVPNLSATVKSMD